MDCEGEYESLVNRKIGEKDELWLICLSTALSTTPYRLRPRDRLHRPSNTQRDMHVR